MRLWIHTCVEYRCKRVHVWRRPENRIFSERGDTYGRVEPQPIKLDFIIGIWKGLPRIGYPEKGGHLWKSWTTAYKIGLWLLMSNEGFLRTLKTASPRKGGHLWKSWTTAYKIGLHFWPGKDGRWGYQKGGPATPCWFEGSCWSIPIYFIVMSAQGGSYQRSRSKYCYVGTGRGYDRSGSKSVLGLCRFRGCPENAPDLKMLCRLGESCFIAPDLKVMSALGVLDHRSRSDSMSVWDVSLERSGSKWLGPAGCGSIHFPFL